MEACVCNYQVEEPVARADLAIRVLHALKKTYVPRMIFF
jgi:hypothetical protein